MRFLLFLVLALTLGLNCNADTNRTLLFLIPDRMGNETVIQNINFNGTFEIGGNLKVSSDDKSMRAKEEYVLIVPNWEDIRRKLQASLRLVMRCSRRYHPGLCSEPMHSVWAYSFHTQNCTERIGCRQFLKQSNRFPTHSECMKSCRPLIDVYSHVVAVQDNGTLADYDDEEVEGRGEEDDYTFREAKGAHKGIETLDNLIAMVEDYSDDVEVEPASVETREKKPPEEIQHEMPVDIDSEPEDYMEVHYDFNTKQYRRPTRN